MPAAAIDTPSGPIGLALRRRLAGFARTLRDNGFKVGLAETRDALAILTLPLAAKPVSLKSALRSVFCATHSDWERFDDIFEAFWRNRGMRRTRIVSGAASGHRPPSRRLTQAEPSALELPDRVERHGDDD